MNRSVVLLLLLISLTPLSFAGRTVTDGFKSAFVRPSITRPTPDPDPCFRFFDVYLPDEFDTEPDRKFPIVYHLTGLGGDYTTYSEPDRLAMDGMRAREEVVPMIIVAPDPAILNYSGSFWTDSSLVDDPDGSFNNKFERYIIEELIPFVDEKYRQKRTAEGDAGPFRAIMGQSMGGYGSLFFAIRHPELFCAFAADSATAFWLINSNLSSPPEVGFPDGNPMFSFNKLLIPSLANSTPPGRLQPDNDDITFGFFSWAGAFSPIVQGIGPENCTLEMNECLTTAPFCVTYPFVVGPGNVPLIVGGSFVPVQPIINLWEKYDPFVFVDALDPDILKRKAIYFDAGADLKAEPVDNVGARFFSDKLAGLDVNNEFLLYDGGHSSCTTTAELECYRFTTNLKLFSGKFSEAGEQPTKTVITGIQTIELLDNSSIQILDKGLVALETAHEGGVTFTDVTINIRDSGRLEIGTEDRVGGGLQIGNPYGKANLQFDPSRVDDTIQFTLSIDGPEALLKIGKQGYLGFGVGIDGNNTDVANYWGLSSLTNVDSITLDLRQGRFEHNQIASSLEERGSLCALGESNEYFLTLNPDTFVISGGANLATMTQANRIHPTVQNTAGVIDPGGIRNRIVENPDTTFDDFYGPPKGVYASLTFSQNLMSVGLLSSSLMLFDTNKQPLENPATQEQLFEFLSVANYFEQGRKRASINELDGQLVVGYITPQADQQGSSGIINRFVVDTKDSCNPLSVPFLAAKILKQGAVGIALATIDGRQQIVRLFDLNP